MRGVFLTHSHIMLGGCIMFFNVADSQCECARREKSVRRRWIGFGPKSMSASLFFLIFQKYLCLCLFFFFHLFLFSISSVFPALCAPSLVFFLISDDNCCSQSYRWVHMTMWLNDQILNTLILLMMKSFFSFIFIWATVQKIIPITCLL